MSDYEYTPDIDTEYTDPTELRTDKRPTALEMARIEIADAESKFERGQEGSTIYRELSDDAYARAAIYAAVAQAEALTRMADAAEVRNVLLSKSIRETAEAAQLHTEGIAQSVSKFVATIYGDEPRTRENE